MTTATEPTTRTAPEHDAKRWRPRCRARCIAVTAALAAVALAGTWALTRSDDSGSDVAATPEPAPAATEVPSGFVGTTRDGALHRYSPTGEDFGVIADTGWSAGTNAGRPELDVSPDGETVYFSRPFPSEACGPGTRLVSGRGTEVVSVPLAGGEVEVVAPRGGSPAVSPDGSQLAYLAPTSGDECVQSAPYALWVRDLGSGEARRVEVDFPQQFTDDPFDHEVAPVGPVRWSPNGDELLFSSRCAVAECESLLTTIVPARGGEARYVYQWGEGFGGAAVAFDDGPDRAHEVIYVDASAFGSTTKLGVVRTDAELVTPDEATHLVVTVGGTGLGSISTLPDHAPGDKPGVLFTTPGPGHFDADPEAAGAWLFVGMDEPLELLAEGVVNAAWLPGTTWDDLATSAA